MVTYLQRTVDQLREGVDDNSLRGGMPLEITDVISPATYPDAPWYWGVCSQGAPQVLLGHEYHCRLGDSNRAINLHLVHDVSTEGLDSIV